MNTPSVLLSFIIPVFNVEKYLENCVNSIISQMGQDCEVILIDDGSTDNSGIICDRLSSINKQVLSFHKENGGLSEARNFGIKQANGQYLAFIDGDDFIDSHSVEHIRAMVLEKTAPDVIFMRMAKFYDEKTIVSSGEDWEGQYINGKSKKEVLVYLASLSKFPASASSKIVKSQCIREKGLYFKKDLLSEDVDWTLRLLQLADTFGYCDCEYYYYRQNRLGSITSIRNPKRMLDLVSIIEIHSHNLNCPNKEYFYSFLAYELAVAILLYSKFPLAETAREIEMKVRELAWLLKYNHTAKIRFVRICYVFLGLKVASLVLRLSKFASEKLTFLSVIKNIKPI